VYDDPEIVAFRDIDPKAPTHVLLIPRKHIDSIEDLEQADGDLLGRMILAARGVAHAEGIAATGYRLVLNTGANGGQSVFHVHLHLLGGRRLTWPPG
jgi:histidine triad (HIT) family protein